MYCCWVDNLNFFSLTGLLVLRLRYNFNEVRYLLVSKTAKKIISILRLNESIDFKVIQDAAVEMSSCEEREIYHKSFREINDFSIEIARMMEDKNSFILSGARFNKAKISLFFKQEIAREISDFLTMASFMEWFKSHSKTGKVLFLVKNNLWLKFIYKHKAGLTQKTFSYPDITGSLRQGLVFLKIIIEIILNSMEKVFFGKRLPPITSKAPKVAVMYTHEADLEKKADFFWFRSSDIDPQRILVYFKYDCFPPDKKATGLIDSYNMNWIDLLPYKVPRNICPFGTPEFHRFPRASFIQGSILDLLNIVWMFLRCILRPDKVIFWQLTRIANLINRVTFYKAFFDLYNVKIHYGLYEAGIDLTASNIAIELAQGVDMSHHWSNYDITEVSIGKTYDIYFTWGPYYYRAGFFDKRFYELKYLVFSGYPYDYLFPESKIKAQAHRKILTDNGARFIITFFDQNYSPQWPKAVEDARAIYSAMLKKVIDDPDFGLITKPKKIRNFWQRIPNLNPLEGLAKKALSTGRALFLDGDVLSSEAASAADLVVGFGVYSTPALEAALSGLASVTCDLQNFQTHPFYKQGFNSIVFNDLEIMAEEIENFKLKNQGNQKFGDYSFILEEIDPYRDGKACQRIGFVIRRLLREFDNSNDRLAAMENSLGEFKERWGSNKVVDLR